MHLSYVQFAFTPRQAEHQIDLKISIVVETIFMSDNRQLLQCILIAIGSIMDTIFLQTTRM